MFSKLRQYFDFNKLWLRINRPWLRSKKAWLVIIGVVIVLLGVYYWSARNSQPTFNKSLTTIVQTTTVKQKTIPVNVEALGSLTAVHEVDISPEVDGQVAKIGFQNGEAVKQGALLFQLDDSVAKAQLAAEAAKYRLSKTEYQRNRRLLDRDALSQQALDQAKEQLAENKARMDEKQLLVKEMRLTAPFDGVVGNRQVSVGQYVSVGEKLVTLVDTKNLKVVYFVPETYLSQLKLGQVVEVSSDVLPGETFSGTVTYISPSIDVDTRSVEVHADVPNEAGQLAPGMFVNVKQGLSERQNALVIPAQALLATITGSEVYIVEDGHAVETPVKVGARLKDIVEITHGLNKDDRVIIAGQQKLRDGVAVKVDNQTDTTA